MLLSKSGVPLQEVGRDPNKEWWGVPDRLQHLSWSPYSVHMHENSLESRKIVRKKMRKVVTLAMAWRTNSGIDRDGQCHDVFYFNAVACNWPWNWLISRMVLTDNWCLEMAACTAMNVQTSSSSGAESNSLPPNFNKSENVKAVCSTHRVLSWFDMSMEARSIENLGPLAIHPTGISNTVPGVAATWYCLEVLFANKQCIAMLALFKMSHLLFVNLVTLGEWFKISACLLKKSARMQDILPTL